ncbi:hypothetical protein DWB90_05380 [Staphylococcus chromogenes]|nr:hypothetical protein DWB90_05380 [Staphylococcus chromogenes]
MIPRRCFMFIMCYLGSCIISFLLQFSIGNPLSKFSIFTRSKCKQCQKTLQWWMVLPIWSYIFLRGSAITVKRQFQSIYGSVNV